MWPDDRELPVKVEAAFGADLTADPGVWSWTDLSDRLSSTPVNIRVPEGKFSPGTCSVTLLNDDGALTPSHPMSPFWPDVTLGTPFRVSIRRVEDLFGRTVSNDWGTADSGQMWTGYGFGGTILNSDFAVGGGKASQSVPTTSAFRAAWLPGLSVLDCRVRLSGVSLPFTDVTGGSVEPGNILLRMQNINTYYMARVEITTAEAVVAKLFNPAGTQLASATVAGLTHSAAQTLEVVAEIVGSTLRMKVWATGSSEPVGWTVTARDTSLRLPGGIGVRTGVGGGNTNTKPVVASYDSITVHVDRFSGFADQWEPTFTPIRHGESASAVRVTASGILRRLGQGSPPVLSPFRRTVTSDQRSGLLAYWPCEDEGGATRAASALLGGAPMTASSSVRFADLDGDIFANSGGVILGFGPGLLPGTADGNRAANVDQGTLTGQVLAGTSNPIRWSVCWLARPVTSGATYSMVRWDTPGGSNTQWEYRHADVSTQSGLWGKRASDEVWVQYASLFDDSPTLREYRVEAWQDSPGGMGLRLWVDGVQILNGFFVDTLGRVTQVAVNPDGANVDALAVAHVQVWDTENPPRLGVAGMTDTAQPTDSYGVKVYPFQRWLNETAHDRLARLCAEDGIAVDIPPVDAAFVVRMGQQPDATSLEMYGECADADMGVLVEQGFGLAFIPRASRYNKPVDLTVDLAEYKVTGGGGRGVLSPSYDDQRICNELVVSRVDGSSVVAADPVSQARNGVYDSSAALSLAVDAQLPDQASWRLHVLSVGGLREDAFPLDLAANPELVDRWLSCRVGSRILRTNPPSQYGPDPLDRLVEGWSETIGPRSWLVQVAPAAASPWDVATVDGPQRRAAEGSTLAAGITAGVLSMQITSTAANGPWTTLAADFPLDMRVGGERVTASAIGPSAVDTFTRTVSNGWGTSPSGQVWTMTGGAASDYSTTGSVARHTHTATNSLHHSLIDVGASDVELLADVTLAIGSTSGAPVTHWVVARAVDASNYYTARLDIGVGTAVNLILTKRVGGALAGNLASGPVGTHTAGATWRIRFSCIGSTLMAKAWLASGTEPGWQVFVTDTDLTAGTLAGLLSRFEGGNTNTLPQAIAWDNFTVTNPQTVTLSARGVNGVQRSWPAGTEVDVWQPAIYAL